MLEWSRRAVLYWSKKAEPILLPTTHADLMHAVSEKGSDLGGEGSHIQEGDERRLCQSPTLPALG